LFRRTDQLDLYVDESPLLEYALSRYDDNCSIKYASHLFGENSYAFALPKGSWLKVHVTYSPYICHMNKVDTYRVNNRW